MNDLLKVLNIAKESYTCLEKHNLQKLIEDIRKKDSSLTLDWDDGAGEEWVRFFSVSLGTVCMIHVKLPIAFVCNSYDYSCIGACLRNIEIVYVDSFSEDEWSVDLGRLKDKVPEIDWHTSIDIVNPDSFSLSDLYYATV